MRWSIFFILAGLCLSFHPPEQPDILQYPITLAYQAATLQEILHDIRDRYQIKFAYRNNEMPEDQAFSIQADNRPLGWVLDELLRETDLSYRVVNGQVVLKKEDKPVPPLPASANAVRSGEASYPSPAQEAPQPTVSSPLPATTSSSPTPVAEPVAGNSTTTGNVLAKLPAITSRSIPYEGQVPVVPKPSGVDTTAIRAASSPPRTTNRAKTSSPPTKQHKLGQKISRGVHQAVDRLTKRSRTDSSDYLRRALHVGLIYPLSSNGVQAGQIVNGLSLHLLVGYAAGLDGIEFSAFGNIENDFMQGVQFAGFFNVVRRRVEGVQAAGFVNVNGGATKGAQLAGFGNVGAGIVNGVQAAGFVNIATGHQQGAQLAGFVNLLSDSIRGVQGSGFANIATGGVRGAQLSGFINYTHSVQGLQAAGFANVASGDVRGGQVAGFINHAHYVKGVQIGVINLADSIDGVPIGLISIVRKNGYRRLELWYSEALQANIAFKMGVPRFYNMLVFGTQFADTDFRWGLGYGIGTLLPITPAFSMNMDLFAMQIREDGWQLFDNAPLNLLNTLRISFNLHLAKHLTLFAAPTFNVMVSEYRQADSGTFGSRITPSWTVYDRTFERARYFSIDGQTIRRSTNVQMWPGFHVGLRF